MASRKGKDMHFRQLRKSHTWVWLIIFAFLLMLTGLIIGIFISIYISGVFTDKLRAEGDTARNMGQVYDTCLKEGSDPSVILDAFGRDYIITDSGKNIQEISGENTIVWEDDPEGISDFPLIDIEIALPEVTIVSDEESRRVFSKDSEDPDIVKVNIIEIIRNFSRYSFVDSRSTARSEEADFSDRMMSIPLWLETSIDGGARKLFAKSYFSVDIMDMGVFLVSLVILFAIGIIVFIAMTINIVSSITRRRKTLKVFLTDVLTQGNNMMFFLFKGDETIKKLRNYGNRYAVVNFVFVNYRTFCVCHSIREGEQKVCEIYDRIKLTLEKKSEICAHCGDASFALLLKCTDEAEVNTRLHALIEGLSHIDSDHVFAFHAGVAIIEPDGTVGRDGQPIRRKAVDFELVYNNACTTCESLSGSDDSGVVFFNEKLIEDQKWIDAVQEHQQAAVANEEFMVYYQPKYDPRTDELRGAEALIRWQSPDFGFVPPGRIIPIFEKNGFITEIDHYMISHVAKDQKTWLDMGYSCVPVSVNVSRAHFIENDLAEQIRDMVDAAGCPHDLIEIELTESAFFDDKKAMINTITRLKSYGFAVSMDDFGSGYSSLNSLKDMPLDVLKLDAEFFRGENDDGRGEIVVSEAIRLAKSLNMRTVAEGVEVREQVDFLAAQGCDMIQGYYYAKPMPKNDYEIRVKNGHALDIEKP